MALSRYEQFRRAIRDLSVLAEQDIAVLWRSMEDAKDAADNLLDFLPELTDAYRSAAAVLAADFYDDLREASAVRGAFMAIIPDGGSTATDSLVRWALKSAQDSASFQSHILGGVQSRIANAARDVVTTSAVQDRGAGGWMRIGAGGCDFCVMLVGRGAVYSESTVGFASHDHCRCSAAPAFNPEQVRDVQSEFVLSARRRSESTRATDNERVHDWISQNL